MKKPLVIYHGNCADGFTGAWCFWRKYGDEMEYHPGVYQHTPPDVTDRNVFLVDFSYKREVVKDMLLLAKNIVLLDHHKSAIDDLWDLEADGLNVKYSGVEQSGAVIAWNYIQKMCDTKERMPEMILHVQDRDLWQFKLEGTRELSEYMFSQEYDFKVWNQLMSMTKHERNKAITLGGAILVKHFKDVNELLRQLRRPMVIGGYAVEVACMPYMMASDAGSIMSLAQPFAGTYYDTISHRCFSLRSNAKNPAAVDVSVIAEQYKGGGHKHSSGFKVDRNHPLAKA
jgi:oligoribonuclease NrnB/cAMP/cGMP phosphodiesterase (DHH superfamily)